jgi:hypothetical protein
LRAILRALNTDFWQGAIRHADHHRRRLGRSASDIDCAQEKRVVTLLIRIPGAL